MPNSSLIRLCGNRAPSSKRNTVIQRKGPTGHAVSRLGDETTETQRHMAGIRGAASALDGHKGVLYHTRVATHNKKGCHLTANSRYPFACPRRTQPSFDLLFPPDRLVSSLSSVPRETIQLSSLSQKIAKTSATTEHIASFGSLVRPIVHKVWGFLPSNLASCQAIKDLESRPLPNGEFHEAFAELRKMAW